MKKINVLGVGINPINLREAVLTISKWIDNKQRQYVNCCTVHTVMECHRDPLLKSFINKGRLAVPDGMPLVWLCRYFGFSRASRVSGPDLMDAFFEFSEKRGYSHCFYGGRKGVVELLVNGLNQRYPRLNVAGAITPPYMKKGDMADPATIDAINTMNPDVVWVGLNTPKQNYWIFRHRKFLNSSVLIAVGAAFDFHAGTVRRAPFLLQHLGLEWLYRFIQEPKRLWYRYLIYNPLFVFLILTQLIGLRRYPMN